MVSRQIFTEGGIMLSCSKILISCSAIIVVYSSYDVSALSITGTDLDVSSLFLSKDDAAYGAKLARVCFVLDAGNCEGYKFNINEQKQCAWEGYTLTSCPALQRPDQICPYNENFFARCVCIDGLVTCLAPYQGVGPSCGGKYQSCCNTCPGYDYSTIPDGYESIGSCDSCTGVKHQIKLKHVHSYSCRSGYQSSSCGSGYRTVDIINKECSCGAVSGSCYKCERVASPSSSSGGGVSGFSCCDNRGYGCVCSDHAGNNPSLCSSVMPRYQAQGCDPVFTGCSSSGGYASFRCK